MDERLPAWVWGIDDKAIAGMGSEGEGWVRVETGSRLTFPDILVK